MEKNVQTLLRLPEVLRNKLKAEAKFKGKTLNGLILDILWQYVGINSAISHHKKPF